MQLKKNIASLFNIEIENITLMHNKKLLIKDEK